jgi:hypothetical protein
MAAGKWYGHFMQPTHTTLAQAQVLDLTVHVPVRHRAAAVSNEGVVLIRWLSDSCCLQQRQIPSTVC